MAANNQITIIGRVGAQPEMKYLDSGKVITKFNLAVKRFFVKEGKQDTDWFQCHFWGKQGEMAGEMIKKGAHISVTGTMRIDKWESNDGKKGISPLVLGDNFYFCESKKETVDEFEGAPEPDVKVDDGSPPF